jgi:hypothetical protein
MHAMWVVGHPFDFLFLLLTFNLFIISFFEKLSLRKIRNQMGIFSHFSLILIMKYVLIPN